MTVFPDKVNSSIFIDKFIFKFAEQTFGTRNKVCLYAFTIRSMSTFLMISWLTTKLTLSHMKIEFYPIVTQMFALDRVNSSTAILWSQCGVLPQTVHVSELSAFLCWTIHRRISGTGACGKVNSEDF